MTSQPGKLSGGNRASSRDKEGAASEGGEKGIGREGNMASVVGVEKQQEDKCGRAVVADTRRGWRGAGDRPRGPRAMASKLTSVSGYWRAPQDSGRVG